MIGYEESYETCIDEMYCYGSYFGMNRDVLQDLIQDVFLSYYELKEEDREEVNSKFYLLCCLKNRIISLKRKEMRHLELRKEMQSEILAEEEHNSVERKEERKYYEYRFKLLFNLLTTRQKEVIYLHYIKELNYDDIAVQLGITAKEVRKLTYRALEKMKEGSIYLKKREGA